MLLSLDGTLFVQLVNFIVFIVILNAIFLKPVGSAIAARRAYIDSVGADITQYEADLKALRSQGDDTRSAARRAADATIGQSRAQAQAEAAAIIAEHQVEASVIIAEAQSSVGLEIAQARSSGGPVIEALARQMLERAVGPEAVPQ
jgi:F-type H+-transporting ATPase subunit b